MRFAQSAARSGVAGIGLLTTIALSLACAGGGGSAGPAPGKAQGAPVLGSGAVSRVEVVAHTEMPSGDHRSQWDKYTAGPQLQERVVAVLKERNAYAANGPLSVRIEVTDFRLRSGNAAFWVGAMAGADYYNVHVEVSRGGRVVRSYDTNTSTSLGGIAYASPTQRTNRLIKTLAVRIVNDI
ncbi:MAG: DUF4410 domain-containing protein [Proteobacteria bacterium]|nr:DUF4410 domain-containing protein [Pseudomonadota bacterium]